MNKFVSAFEQCGLVAILRGIEPGQALEAGQVLYQQGFRVIEVPLNSPAALESIQILAQGLPEDCLVGAGTVLEAEQVDLVREAGGQLIVMPHCDSEVISRAKSLGMYCAPGVCTPTEAFAALSAGADALKLFPAELVQPQVMKAWRAVLPRDTRLVPVGGIGPDNMAQYKGAAGFGLGSGLYSPGVSKAQLEERAIAYVQAWSTFETA